jgi:hypothetical protein
MESRRSVDPVHVATTVPPSVVKDRVVDEGGGGVVLVGAGGAGRVVCPGAGAGAVVRLGRGFGVAERAGRGLGAGDLDGAGVAAPEALDVTTGRGATVAAAEA